MNFKVWKSQIPCLALLIILGGCGTSEEETSETKWWVNFSATGTTSRVYTPGHEVLVRAAIEKANTAVGQNFYSPIIPADIDAPEYSQNGLIVGNFSTDRPDDTAFGRQLRDLYHAPTGWHEEPNIQSLHFLRDFKGDGDLTSGIDSCRASQAKIIGAVARADQLYRSGNRSSALQFLGHATHILQDSFSPEHTQREGLTILDLCSYGREKNGVCKHTATALGDNIFEWGPNQDDQCQVDKASYTFPESCMKPAARDAITATTALLTAFAKSQLDPTKTSMPASEILADLESNTSADILSCGQIRDKNPSLGFVKVQAGERCLIQSTNRFITKDTLRCAPFDSGDSNALLVQYKYRCAVSSMTDADLLSKGRVETDYQTSCLTSEKSTWQSGAQSVPMPSKFGPVAGQRCIVKYQALTNLYSSECPAIRGNSLNAIEDVIRWNCGALPSSDDAILKSLSNFRALKKLSCVGLKYQRYECNFGSGLEGCQL